MSTASIDYLHHESTNTHSCTWTHDQQSPSLGGRTGGPAGAVLPHTASKAKIVTIWQEHAKIAHFITLEFTHKDYIHHIGRGHTAVQIMQVLEHLCAGVNHILSACSSSRQCDSLFLLSELGSVCTVSEFHWMEVKTVRKKDHWMSWCVSRFPNFNLRPSCQCTQRSKHGIDALPVPAAHAKPPTVVVDQPEPDSPCSKYHPCHLTLKLWIKSRHTEASNTVWIQG